MQKMEKTIIYLIKKKRRKKQVHSAGRVTLLPVFFFLFFLIADKILYNIFYTVSLSSRRMYFFYQLQLRLSRMCSENAGKLRTGVPKSC